LKEDRRRNHHQQQEQQQGRGPNRGYEGKMTPREDQAHFDPHETHARQQMGAPPSMPTSFNSNSTTTSSSSTDNFTSNRQSTLGVVSRRELMNAMDLTSALNVGEEESSGGRGRDSSRNGGSSSTSQGRSGKVREIEVNQFQPSNTSKIRTSPINKTATGSGSSSTRTSNSFNDLETSDMIKQPKLTASELKKSDGQMFNHFMGYCKESGYFQDFDRGTTEYNMKIQGLIGIFEQWKTSGRNGSLLEYSGMQLTDSNNGGGSRQGGGSLGGSRQGGSGSREQQNRTPPRRAASPYESKISPPQNSDSASAAVASSSSPTPAEKSRNEMFQAFLEHARSRGFFDGCDKGTAEYNHKVSQCIVKFEELREKQGYPQ